MYICYAPFTRSGLGEVQTIIYNSMLGCRFSCHNLSSFCLFCATVWDRMEREKRTMHWIVDLLLPYLIPFTLCEQFQVHFTRMKDEKEKNFTTNGLDLVLCECRQNSVRWMTMNKRQRNDGLRWRGWVENIEEFWLNHFGINEHFFFATLRNWRGY